MTEPDSKTDETSTEEVATVESQETPPTETPEPESAAAPEEAPARAEPEPTEATSAAETVSGEAAETTAAAETMSGEAAAAEATAETLSGETAPEGGKKKRRRRRKKKGAGTSEAPRDSKEPQHHAPFLHLFAGAPRKHAFSVGELIAGRVERVDQGTIVVDLFGKASAIADVDEPRDVPIILQEEQAEEPVAATSDAPAADAASESSESASAETASGEDAAAAEGPTPETEAVATPAEPSVSEAPAESTSLSPEAIEATAASWEVSESEVTDIHDVDGLAEADTVVAAQAFEITAVSAQAYEATVPPPQTSAEPGSSSEPEAQPTEAASESGETAGGSTEPQAAGATDAPAALSEAPEDLSDADMSLLEPLPAQEPPQIGAIFRGRIGAVAESGHIAIVNRVVDKAAVRKALRAARAEHKRVNGVVYGFNRGGFDVLVGGVRAFCPASAMSLTPIEDPNALIGQRCEFSLPQDKGGKKSIIVSRRNILEKEARKRARERMAALEVGEKIQGKVLEVRDYGALVDLGGGLDGLVHMSEVSWSRGVRPQDVVKPGDEVEVQVLKVQPATRKDRFGRVSLSMRACMPDPWDEAADLLRPGTPVKGKVVRTTDFGAFIQVSENIEGLLHISELGGNKELTHAKQAVSEGDEIDVVIERVDKEQRRISLSKLSEADAKAIEAGEIEIGKAPRSLKPGSHIAVVVKRVEHNGAQVQVDGMLGKRGRGFIPNRELQDVRGENRKGPSQGDVIEVKVIGTERDGTLRCSIRARLLDEERKAVREYRKESAKQGLGTFGDLLKAKLGDPND
jgi:small subunit ribosomal protein S1